jgi:pimeloyl-ACP methyl ester carboxylesterase
MSSIRHSTVQTNGVRIHLAEQGQGPLVLFVHGFPELWYSWRHQLAARADAGYRAVAIDQRGYGRSSKFWDPLEYRISRLVADVVGVVRALGEQTAVLVGHDWGALVAWTAAWQHPEVFRAVVGMSVPFSGRGLVALPGSPFGEVRPSELHRCIAGDQLDFYQEYLATLGPSIAEVESDVRGWLRDVVWSFSGGPPMPPGFDPGCVDPIALTRVSAACIPHGARMRDRLVGPERMPAWFTEADLDYYVEEFERTGFACAVSYYRALDASWEELLPMVGKPVSVPALFIGAERDVTTLWGAEAIARAKEHIPEYAGSVILPGAGHWIQQERPAETNRLLLDFLDRLPRSST